MLIRDAQRKDLPEIQNLILQAHRKNGLKMFLFQGLHVRFQILGILVSLLVFWATSSLLLGGLTYLTLVMSLYAAMVSVVPRMILRHRNQSDFLHFPVAYRRNGGRFLVGEKEGRIVAMIGLLDRGGALMEMTSLVVSPSHRRKGFGQRMVEEAIRWAEWEGKTSIVYDTLNANPSVLLLLSSYEPKVVSPPTPIPNSLFLSRLMAFRILRYRIGLDVPGSSVQRYSRVWFHWADKNMISS